MKNLKTIIWGLLFIPGTAVAASIVDPNATPATTAAEVTALIGRLQGIVLGAAGAVAVAMIIWGAIILGTAGGNEEKLGKGKKILTYAIGGLIFILAAGFLIGFFIRILGGDIN